MLVVCASIFRIQGQGVSSARFYCSCSNSDPQGAEEHPGLRYKGRQPIVGQDRGAPRLMSSKVSPTWFSWTFFGVWSVFKWNICDHVLGGRDEVGVETVCWGLKKKNELIKKNKKRVGTDLHRYLVAFLGRGISTNNVRNAATYRDFSASL